MDDIKLAGKKQHLDPMWKVLNKEVDLGEPTSFLDHVYLVCTQRECETSKDIVDNYRNLFEKSHLVQGNLTQTSLHGPMIRKFVQRIVCRDIANWRTNQPSNCTKLQLHALMTIEFKEEELGSVGELSKVCSQIVLKCQYSPRIGRPDILWSLNKLARASTKLTRACDKRLARLISKIHPTSKFKQNCHVGNTAQQCKLGLFRDSDFAGDLEDSKSTSGGTLCIFGSHTFVPMSWICKKQTSVSHSSTESEIISLDAGLSLDGIPALDFWDLIVAVLGITNQNDQDR